MMDFGGKPGFDSESEGVFDESQGLAPQDGAAPAVAGRNPAMVLQPDANNVVILPAGTELDAIRVDGRDLVVVLADGSIAIIPDGAIVVPQLVVEGVSVPAETIAALLTGNEPEPAAGAPQSSGGNFAADPGAIQDAYALGDLLPYTELAFDPPREREIIPARPDRDASVVIETPGDTGGAVDATGVVDEAGLPERTVGGAGESAGTEADGDGESTSGTIVFAAPDGVGSVTIDGVAITNVGQTFETGQGVLTITSIDLAGGRIGFEYTLTDNVAGDDAGDFFTIAVTDIDGDSSSATLRIDVIDDAPIARVDSNAMDAGSSEPATGNVLDNDEPGADGYSADGAVGEFSSGNGSATAGETLAGEYGTLTLNADGSYSYVRDPGTPGGVQDVFSYTIVDGDGSTAEATLTIDIADAQTTIDLPTEGEAGTQVLEEGLPAGSNAASDGEFTSGTITYTAPDGPAVVTIGGTSVSAVGDTVTGTYGTLTVTAIGEGVVSYTYELTTNTDGDDTYDSFAVTITDQDGDSSTGDLVIDIVDDVPTARDDWASGSENAPVTVDALGNDTPGADGVDLATQVAVVDGTLTGAGTVVYNGDGSFTYTPTPGEEGTVSFDYQITDGDGDPSVATVTITLPEDSAPDLSASGANEVDEAALGARPGEPEGSNAASDGEHTSGTIEVATGNDGIGSLVIDGVDVTGGGTVTSDKGVLTVSVSGGNYSYSYELTDNTLADPDSDSFDIVLTDSDGDSASTTLVIDIIDDAPEARDDADTVPAGEYGPIGGNVLTNDTQGADGADVTGFSGAGGSAAAGGTVQGAYGMLTLNADGSYSYTRDPGTPADVSDSFPYTITDGDGDTSDAVLIIWIGNSGTTIDLPTEGEAGTQVLEEGLPAGSNAASDGEFTSGTITYTAPDGPAVVTIGGTSVSAVGDTVAGTYGTLTVTAIGEGVVSYTYELTTNTDGDDTFDSFAVTITDQDGDSSTGDLVIDIVDDVPTARADSDSVGEDGPLVADGNILTGGDLGYANASDGVADTFGADGASLTGVTYNGDTVGIGSVFTAQYGTITIEANGDYRYELDATHPAVAGLGDGETLSEVFTYTITDGDGDPSTTTLTIVIDGVDDPVVINGLDLQGGELTVDEDDLADGSSPDPASLTQASSFTVDSPDGLAALSIGGTAVFGTGIGYPITLTGDYGTIRIVSVDPVTDSTGDVISATVNYEYVLSDNTLDHGDPGQDILVDSFAVVATDKDGSQDNATLDVEVIDDVPLATDDSAGQAIENADIVIDALANDVFGADGVDTADGAKVSVTAQASQGTVTYDPATGLFTYSPNAGAGSGGNTTDSFEYTIVDGDGDSSTATVTVELKPDSEPSGGEVAATVDDDGMAGGNPSSTAGDIDANVNDDPADTSEASFTGSLAFDVGNDAPASIEFDPALDGTTATVGQETVTYSISTQSLVATGPRGVLFTVEITDPATGAYTVTLNDNVLHGAGPDDEHGMANVSLDLIVSDIDGDTAATTLNIAFNDDAPTALDDDGGSVTEGGTTGGNLLTNDTAGADGYAAKAIAGIGSEGEGTASTSTDGSGNYVLQGSYGTLTVNATTGVYSYQSAANSTNVDATDVFTYSVVDGDGDVASAKLEIDIDNVAGKVSDNDALVNEAGLPGGSDPSSDSEKDIDGQITVTDASGTLTYTLTGANSDGIGNYGDLVLDSTTGAYTYTLNTPYTDTDAGENVANTVNGAESFAYVVKDHLGNEIGTGSIEVGIVDDVPNAVDETALSIAEDAASPDQLSGNVTGNDTSGADGASVTSFSVGSDTIAVPQDGNSATHTTANGTYTMDMAGNWTFDPTPGLDHSGGPIDAGFSYRLTDGDDDYATATQPITITDGADPDNPADASLELDDQNLADGSTPAGSDSDSATISFVAGSDPYAGFAFGDTSNLAGGLTWARVDDTTITGSDGARLVVTLKLTVVGNDATVTATLEDNYLGHSSQGDELDALGSLSVIATDIDGDQSVGTVTLGVSDDVPTMTASAAADGALAVDESDLSTDASASFASLFTPDYNADGAGSVGGYTLGINAGATGLVDTASGQPVVLVVSGNVVTGRTQTSGVDVFTVSVDAAGTVTLNQLRAVQHDDASDSDDVTALDAANLITLSATASDGDGDTVTAVANIGGALSFRDDGPAIDASVTDGDAITLATQDADTKGAASDTDSSTAAFGGAFGVASSSYGADGAGSISWDYSLSVDNAVSGLSSDGVPVSLALVGGVVEGRANGELVFTIAVDAGTGAVTLTQHEEIDHALPGASGSYATQLETLATGLVSLKGTASITDGDGDVALEIVTLDLGGNISFADDGPSVTASGSVPSLEVDETDLATDASQSFASLFTFDFGADGPAASGSATYALSVSSPDVDSGLVDTATGQTVLLSIESGVVVGRTSVGDDLVFTLSVDANGIVELDQLRAVEHADPNNADEAIALGSAGLISLTATAKDGDGDTDSASVDVGSALSFRDDGPSGVAGTSSGTVDEDGLANGIAGGTSDVPGEDVQAQGSVAGLFSSGADAPLSYGLLSDTSGMPALFSGGVQLSYAVSGNVLTASAGTDAVFTFALDPNSGAWTFDLLGPLDHAPGDGENATDIEIAFDSLVTAIDADGDSVALVGTVKVTVDDDSPVANADSKSMTETTASVSGNVLTDGSADGFGADGPGTPALSAVTGFGGASGVIGGSTSGEFGTLTLNADGSYSYVLNAASLPSLGDGQSETDTFSYTIVDADGDPSTTTLTITITGTNDVPVAMDDTNWVLYVVVGPDPVASGNVLASQAHAGAPSGAFADIADTDGDGDTLSVTAVAGGSVGTALAGTYGSIVINANGTYSYTLDADNPAVDALDTGETLSESFTYTASDGVGSDTATLTITIFGTNDAPQVRSASVAVSDEGLAGGNPDTVGSPSDTTNAATASGTVLISDVDSESQTVTLGIPTAALTSGGETIQWSISPNGKVLTGSTTGGGEIVRVTIDDAGAFSVVQSKPIDHSVTGAEDVTSFVVPVTANDGTTSTTNTSGIVVSLEDDSPALATVTAGSAVTIDETTAGDNFASGPISATSASAAISATPSFGGDGAAASNATVYGLSLSSGSASGLQTAVGDYPITLAQTAPHTITASYSDGSGTNTAFTVVIGSDGKLTVTQHVALEHAVDGSSAASHNDPLDLADKIDATISVTDADGDKATATAAIGGNIVFRDDGPSAVDNVANSTVIDKPIDAAFVLDFSGSIGNDELSLQLNAVKNAAFELFQATTSSVTVDLVIFDGNGDYRGHFTTFSQFAAHLDAMNPSMGGSRPINGSTDFTDAIEELMDNWTPVGGGATINQMFFLSDGNPNQQTGSGGNSLANSTKAAWQNFINDHDVNVTVIGVGDGIDDARLRDVDLDGENTPLRADDFDALIDTLVVAVTPPITGNVLTNDSPGADGARALSITIDGVTFTWNGANTITTTSGPSVVGTSLSVTTSLGGTLEFDFATGAWEYDPPSVSSTASEQFDYTIIDNDGDTSAAQLSIDVAAVTGGANFARNDMVITNQGSTVTVPLEAILTNDNAGTAVTGISETTGGSGTSLSGGNAVFADTGSGGGGFVYDASLGGQADKGFVTIDRTQAGQNRLDGSGGNEALVGRNSRNDELHGNGGADVLFGGTGADRFYIDNGESIAVVQGSGDNGRVSGYDTILDFDTTDDYLDLAGSVSVAGNGAGTIVSNPSLTINGQTVKSHAISDGIMTFDDSNSYGSALSLSTEGHLAAVVDYLQGVDLGSSDTIVAFHVGSDTFVYHQTGGSPNASNDTLVKLAGITVPDLSALIGDGTIAPVALDLDGDGVEFLGLSAGVLHDYGSGTVLTAWVGPDDGLLARSTGSGLDIVFTDDAPGAGSDLEGLRLAYDTDGDGRLTAADADWANFGVWQDADIDGSLDEGEFASLDDLGIVSIDLVGGGAPYSAANDDVTVVGTSHFTKANGSGGQVADAIFATALHRAGQRTAETASIAATAAALALPQSLAAEHDQWPAEAHVTLAGGDGYVGIMAPAYATDDTGIPIVDGLAAGASEGHSAEAADGWSNSPDLASAATEIAATLDDVDAVQATAFGTQQGETSAVDMPLAMASDAVSGMEALLLMQAPVVDDATSLAVAADAALGEIAAEAAVDGVVEFFADGEAQAPSAIHAIGDEALAALLDTGIFAGGPGVAAMAPMNDETAAVLEAAAQA